MKVKNPQDRIRLSYVGMKTVIVPIDKAKKCKIKMESEFEAIGIENDGEGVPNENNPSDYIHLTDEEQALVTPVNDLGFNMLRKDTPMPAFVKVAKDYYDTELSSLDFGSDKSVDEINQKISQRSNGMLPQVQEKAKIGPSMGYALVNTIYFKSIWREKFRKAATNDEVFKDEDGKETLVPMMNQRHKFFYTEDDLCQTLCLPYSNGSYQMIILLPNKGKTVSEVAQSLTADSWQKSYNQLKSILVNVKLPRFESSSDVELTDVMKTLGMPNAFSMTKADFSRLFDLKSCIGMIEQVGRIKVDETGTEASVATLLQGRIAGLDLTPPETVNFYATHPFLYIIREVSTGTIFFIGQYMGT